MPVARSVGIAPFLKQVNNETPDEIPWQNPDALETLKVERGAVGDPAAYLSALVKLRFPYNSC
jgi:hypothetical protein